MEIIYREDIPESISSYIQELDYRASGLLILFKTCLNEDLEEYQISLCKEEYLKLNMEKQLAIDEVVKLYIPKEYIDSENLIDIYYLNNEIVVKKKVRCLCNG